MELFEIFTMIAEREEIAAYDHSWPVRPALSHGH
jgi:hypothetical protein